ncbi:MAG: CbtA family protein [Proteobacteria bacterium]|nr:CbtA family protein [Pseudomonadota bacterium]
MVRETVLAAIVAGLIAALVFTVVQSIWVTPLILQGETYEEAAEHSAASAVGHVHKGHEADGHHHDENEWKPEDGWQRTLFTFGANLLMGVGYAFVLVALYLLWREPRNALGGALYGFAGFLVFFAAPAVGLPPDLPGTAAAELNARQEWWAMTAAATAIGLFLLFSQNRWALRILGIVIVVAPHFVPAPQPAVESSLAPADLQSQFRVATTVCNAVFWVALGIASGVAFRRLVSGGSRAQA